MKYLENFLQMGFNDLRFEGLRFSFSNDSFPWKSDKEREAYLDSLVEDGSELSSLRYKNIYKEISKMEIHIKLSLSVALKALAFFLMGIAILASLNYMPIIGFSVLGISFSAFLFNKYFKRRAMEVYMGLQFAPDMIDFLFANERQSRETK